jgi:hypothetical protein
MEGGRAGSTMRNVLVCTVGTSLKGNLERAKTEKISELLTPRNIQGVVLELLKKEPKDYLAGAEINSITSILEKGLIGKRLNLYFLTATKKILKDSEVKPYTLI